MTVDVRFVQCGAAARAALAAAVHEAKAGDPFAPVTVVVPTNPAAVAVRRSLATAVGDGTCTGVANVSVSTPAALAARLAPASANVPLTPVVLAAAARAALAADHGFFQPVADHPATEQAVVRVHGELCRLRPASLEMLERSTSERTRAVVGLHRDITRRTAGHLDQHALAALAAGAVRDPSYDVSALGTVIVHLVDDLPPTACDLLLALATRTHVEVLLSCTGESGADAPVIDLARRLGGPGEPPAGLVVPSASRVLLAGDCDDEVRSVTRELLARAETGIAFARMAVLYPLAEPYARTVYEQLDAAGIPHHGPSIQRLADTLMGRTLLRLLALRASTFGRDEVVELLRAAPLLDEQGVPVPATRWDHLSRRAGVVGGLDDWHRKLARHDATLAARAERLASDGASAGDLAAVAADRDHLARLRRFVDRLAALLTDEPGSSTWRAQSARLTAVLDSLLGSADTGWPDHEAEAAVAVRAALAHLAELEHVDPKPSAARYARAVLAELDRPARRVGRLGTGVACGRLGTAAALDVDVVFVLGCAEGFCPSVRREDSLLPDHERHRVPAEELPPRTSRHTAEQRRALLLALGAGTHERVLCAPRGDHRAGRTMLPSRWLIDAVSALVGTHVTSGDLATLAHPAIQRVESFAHGVRTGATPVDGTERDLQVLQAWVDDGGDVVEHPCASTPLIAALQARRARRAQMFTRWDGNLAGRLVPSPAGGAQLSASRLETWAACPFRYFLANLLHLGEIERPEAIETISALDRGSLVHAVLERFIGEVTARPPAQQPRPGQPWSGADVERLLAIASDLFAEFEQRGVTGRAVLWQVRREQIADDLRRFVVADTELRAELHTTPAAVELAFGLDGEPPADIELADGRQLAFRGYIDRVDRTHDGELVVLDYKTGRSDRFDALADDPVVAGTKLQLPLYALAASARLDAPTASAWYWFASLDGRFVRRGYPIGPAELQRFRTVLTSIVDGIEAGEFPAAPGAYSTFRNTHEKCVYCEFDRLCPANRGETSAATARAPELARYLSLAVADPADDDADSDGGRR
jgi:hypothetical protein